MSAVTDAERWLIALDIDGTVLHEDGTLDEAVVNEVQRVRGLGHEVMLSTGRSVSMTLPILDRLGISSEYVVSANGAIVMRRDRSATTGYVPDRVETFNPREVLLKVRSYLAAASFAVEDPDGTFRYTGVFPDAAAVVGRRRVSFDELLSGPATRVVVLSPGHAMEDFLSVVEKMGLHKVSYNVGWTAWLDIAPDGVNKGTGMEYVRTRLGIPRKRVMVMGDGRNDIDMFEWAAAGGGVAIAMGQAPDEVHAVSTDVTSADREQGVARALARYFQG